MKKQLTIKGAYMVSLEYLNNSLDSWWFPAQLLIGQNIC